MPTETSRPQRWSKPIVDIVCVLLAVLVTKTALAEPYYVPSGSMEPTLLIGDELLATKYPYGYSSASLPAPLVLPQTERFLASLPQRGDVVVFRWPGDRSQVWVKRVIGLPGDRIAVHAGQVWINGTPADMRPDGISSAEVEDGAEIPAARYVETLPNGREHAMFKLFSHGQLDDMAEVVVPTRHLFVMGDNRDNSADSRIPVSNGGVGFLPVTNLVGRVEAVVGSFDLGAKKQPIWTWPSALRLSRFFTSVN